MDRPFANGASTPLRRELGLFASVMLGLGSMIGTGVFVSTGLAAGVAGPAMLLSIVLAGLVALCNGLSSAQLAASRPVSGGTYEYGYHYLNPTLGFMAGWLFVCAKTASAATAALGFSSYVLSALGVASGAGHLQLALAGVAALAAVALSGARGSSRTNIVLVSVSLLSLLIFVLAGLPTALANGATTFQPFFLADAVSGSAVPAVLHAAALMFVAFTGYGRIATLGEEVREPRRTIPRAIAVAMAATIVLYVAVAAVAIGVAGASEFAAATGRLAAPLETIARLHLPARTSWVLAIGAITAMLGVLLNLILGLSRVLLAMARRGDVPRALGRIDAVHSTPWIAIIVVALLVAALVLIGDVRITWSFSAFTVLFYYAVTNLAALRLRETDRIAPRWVALAGLIGCLALAFWVEPVIWAAGIALMAVGLLWRATVTLLHERLDRR